MGIALGVVSSSTSTRMRPLTQAAVKAAAAAALPGSSKPAERVAVPGAVKADAAAAHPRRGVDERLLAAGSIAGTAKWCALPYLVGLMQEHLQPFKRAEVFRLAMLWSDAIYCCTQLLQLPELEVDAGGLLMS